MLLFITVLRRTSTCRVADIMKGMTIQYKLQDMILRLVKNHLLCFRTSYKSYILYLSIQSMIYYMFSHAAIPGGMRREEKIVTTAYRGEIKSKIRSAFGIADELEMVIQRYDTSWQDFIDVDDMDTLNDRDKLSVVLTRELVIDTPGPGIQRKVMDIRWLYLAFFTRQTVYIYYSKI